MNCWTNSASLCIKTILYEKRFRCMELRPMCVQTGTDFSVALQTIITMLKEGAEICCHKVAHELLVLCREIQKRRQLSLVISNEVVRPPFSDALALYSFNVLRYFTLQLRAREFAKQYNVQLSLCYARDVACPYPYCSFVRFAASRECHWIGYQKCVCVFRIWQCTGTDNCDALFYSTLRG